MAGTSGESPGLAPPLLFRDPRSAMKRRGPILPTSTTPTDAGSRSTEPGPRRGRGAARAAAAPTAGLRESRQALGLIVLLLVMLPAYGISRQFVEDPPEVETAADQANMQQIIEHIRDTAERHGVSEHLVAAIIAVESEFYPRAVSRKGARGLMQLMPVTAAIYNVRDPFDPAENIDGGVRHLKRLMRRYDNNLPLVLAAYNAGEQAVRRHGGIPPYPETRRYVRRVLRKYERAALIPAASPSASPPSASSTPPAPPSDKAPVATAPAAGKQPPAAPARKSPAPATSARGRAGSRPAPAIRVDRARTPSSPPRPGNAAPRKGASALAPAAVVRLA